MAKNQPALLAYRSFQTHLNTLRRFKEASYETFCIFPAHTLNSRGTPYSQYKPLWLWYDEIDFAPLDQMIKDNLKVVPEANFICLIDLNSPAWLEHMNSYACGDSFNNLGKAVHNQEWLQPTENYLREFLKYTEDKYADRIQAYVLACGATDEWYDYSHGTEDSQRRKAWRKWCNQHQLPDPIDIPPESIRDHCAHENFLRDPVIDKTALDYWKFCNEAIADAILSFSSIARTIIRPEAQLGCFYGYILEKGRSSLVSCGHLEYEKVLEAPGIDFLISPGTYRDREIGGGSGFLIPNGSARIRGKRLLHECDQRTHSYNPYINANISLEFAHWPDEKSTVAGLKREAALALLKHTSLWWFDMWGDFYQGEKVMETLGRIRELWTKYADYPAEDVAEVALVVDPESSYYLNENEPNISKVHLETRNKLNRLGAPYEVFSFNDIPRIPALDQYKLIIFNSTFEITPEKESILQRYIFCSNRTVLWLYAPGIVRNGTLDKANCEKLTGIPYAAGKLQSVQMNSWKSAYLYDYDQLTPKLLKVLAEDAGVHLYTQLELPIFADGKRFAVHTAAGGKNSLQLPFQCEYVLELFSGRKFPVKEKRFYYNFKAPDTAIFEAVNPGK